VKIVTGNRWIIKREVDPPQGIDKISTQYYIKVSVYELTLKTIRGREK